MPFLGEIAALTTAACWSFTSLFFTEAGKLIGAFRVNKIRLLFAVVIYSIVLFATTGHVWPENMNNVQFFWLALSGVIGLVIGDYFGFKGFVIIGPRLTTLLWATAPIWVTLIAWFFLDEKLRLLDIAGIVITLAGVAWVVAERTQPNNGKAGPKGHDTKTLLKGVFYGLLAAMGQGVGLVLSKHAMLYSGDTLEALPASFVRMFSSLVIIWLISAFRGQLGDTMQTFRQGRAMLFSLGGSVFGPFFGVWMSLVAVKHIEAGIAATLNSMTPVLIIPLVMIYYKEKVSIRAMLGAVVAVGGVAILMLA